MKGVKTLSITEPSTQSMGLQHSRLTNFYKFCLHQTHQNKILLLAKTTKVPPLDPKNYTHSQYLSGCTQFKQILPSPPTTCIQYRPLLLRKDGRARMRNMGYIPWGVAK